MMGEAEYFSNLKENLPADEKKLFSQNTNSCIGFVLEGPSQIPDQNPIKSVAKTWKTSS